MNTQELVSAISRRLPALRRREVQEVITVMVELWREELSQTQGKIQIAGLGTLYVESHTLKATGVIRQRLLQKYGTHAPLTLRRRVIRFHPYETLRQRMNEEGAQDE